MMSIETMLGATVEELRAIADCESLSSACKDSLYTSADWVVAAIDRITSLEQDNQEQCRLNAMGAEREARLMARVKELEKDAARYRWLRDKADDSSGGLGVQRFNGSRFEVIICDEYLDSAIDTAMKKD